MLASIVIKTPDAEGLMELVRGGNGAFVICSHLGNAEVLRALATTEVARMLPHFGITSIVDFSGTARFNRLLEEVNPGSMLRLVPASDIGVDTIIILKERIASGELVIIAGDRTAARTRDRVSEVFFLREPAYFPQGAFILASLMDAPVYFMFGVREEDRDLDSPYGLYVYKASTDLHGSRRQRMTKVQTLIEEFVERLESLCVAHPLQWYNFYDFWKKPSGEGSPSRTWEMSGGS
jgi:predicted LPLAT superfamily acyltransferase